jgi:hypothetical protein
MQIETYECEETASEPIEACEEALAIAQKCGLSGQMKSFRKTENGHDARCPYRQITKDESAIFSVLCPKRSRVTDYDSSPIPLRVLQVIAHAQSLEFFSRIEVWDKDSPEVKDPVLVGLAPANESWMPPIQYILARWGSELDEMPALRKAAIETKRRQLRNAASEIGLLASKYDADSMSEEKVLAAAIPQCSNLNE